MQRLAPALWSIMAAFQFVPLAQHLLNLLALVLAFSGGFYAVDSFSNLHGECVGHPMPLLFRVLSLRNAASV